MSLPGGLPEPVALYLRASGARARPDVRRVRLVQAGEFLVRPKLGRWGAFEAVEELTARPPSFDWDARIRMAPGLVVRVRDRFADGGGSMRARLFGFLPVAKAEGSPAIDRGALHRYLAEAAWCPPALAPEAGILWTGLGPSSARATLTASGVTVSLDFRFDTDGRIESVFAPDRERDAGGRTEPTPWEGRWTAWGERDGFRIPIAGEVSWLLPEETQTYWRGRVLDARFSAQAG